VVSKPVIAKPTPIKKVPVVGGLSYNGSVLAVANGLAGMKIKRHSPPKFVGNNKSPVTVKSKPIELPNGSAFKNDRNRRGNGRNGRNNRNSAFGTPVDDPTMEEDFDFEKNLALFDKQAIWDEIENGSEKPDLLRQTNGQQQRKYRHDENVITSKPIQLRQIQTEYKSSEEFVTDDGLIIPCVPKTLCQRVQALAASNGFTWERQSDLLGRAATEIAILLLGGAHRLIPKNQHQWPVITIVCDQPYNERQSEVGIITGRHLASHGIKVMVYVKTAITSERVSKELELYTATGNDFTFDVKELPASDLVILAVTGTQLASDLTAWLAQQRGPIIAIDPPATGIKGVAAKCSLVPILPAEGMQQAHLGKMYLCNLSIPLKFFRDSGIKYSSPFGSKFVIPLTAQHK